jgi:hypothetical protein
VKKHSMTFLTTPVARTCGNVIGQG